MSECKNDKGGGSRGPGRSSTSLGLSISRQFCHFHSARRDAIRKQKVGVGVGKWGPGPSAGKVNKMMKKKKWRGSDKTADFEGDFLYTSGPANPFQVPPNFLSPRVGKNFFPVDPTTLLLLFPPSRIQRLSGTTLMILLELKGFVWINFYLLFTTHFVHICLFTLCRDCHLITPKLLLGEWVGKTKTLRWHILKNMCQIWWKVASVSPILVAIK